MGTESHENEVWAEIAAQGTPIGHNVVIRFFQNSKTRKAGLLLYHKHADGSVCGGSVPFRVEGNDLSRPCWEVVSYDPLTLTPSIRDKTCSENLHGYITDGQWRPC